MTIGTHFQHDLIAKYVSVFGTIFNDIYIARSDGTDPKKQFFKVPISYAPREKYWAMLKQKPDGKTKAIQLPRMAFEITGLQYDPTGRGVSRSKYRGVNENKILHPAPWNINFQLNIIAKTDSDALAIVEQILIYFQPEVTLTIRAISEVDQIEEDVPIVYNGISHQDTYEGSDFQTRRALTWSIDFTMKAWLYGPKQTRKVIKHIEVNTHLGPYGSNPTHQVTIQPGLTEDGDPTTDINETIPFADINETDNWAYIVKFEDLDE
jgi:hypothetical protein